MSDTMADPHHFHGSDLEPGICAKCGKVREGHGVQPARARGQDVKQTVDYPPDHFVTDIGVEAVVAQLYGEDAIVTVCQQRGLIDGRLIEAPTLREDEVEADEVEPLETPGDSESWGRRPAGAEAEVKEGFQRAVEIARQPSHVGVYYDPHEQSVVIDAFTHLLKFATRDGGRKRASGAKRAPWWSDIEHTAAIFSHLSRWMHGEKLDPDSGAHPLVHLAWRALAVAWQETYGFEPAQCYYCGGMLVPEAPKTLSDGGAYHVPCFNAMEDAK